MTESEETDLGRRTGSAAVRGLRWAFWLNAVTLPMSFLTSLVLGRSSAGALGVYSATQIFIGGFQTFFIFGGNPVFTRFVPTLPRERRIAFLWSYLALVVGIFTTVALVLAFPARVALDRLLERFGSPAPALAYLVAVTVVIWAFCSYFLYGIEQAPRAALALKFVVVGYFAFAMACLTPAGSALLRDPAGSLWIATAIIYAAAAGLAAAFVAAAPSRSNGTRGGFYLPPGFWSVVVYTHLGTVVEFVYTSLSPSVVLLWLDVDSLGRLTAALRWVTLLSLLPAMFVSVVAPGFARLDASGRRDDALRRTRSAVRAAELAVVPSVFALILFAPAFMGLFGPDYREHAGLLRIAALSALAGPTVYIGSGLAVALGALRAYLAVSVLYVTASLVLNVVLIPKLGLAGAATAMAVSSAAQCVIVTFVLRGVGFRGSRTTWIGWSLGVAVAAMTSVVQPGLAPALGAWLVVTAVFAWAAGATWSELRALSARLMGAR